MADVSHRAAGVGVAPAPADLDAEEAARIAADATLTAAIAAETAARIAADLALGVRIDGVEAGGAGGEPGVIYVTDYGALGNGVADDRAAFEAAITAALLLTPRPKIVVPHGTYLISQVVGQNYGIHLHGATNLTFMGSGLGSVIKVHTPAAEGAADLRLFQICGNSQNIAFYDLCFDGNFPIGTSALLYDEQNHIISCGTGNASDLNCYDVDINRCWFRNVRGDAVRALGSATTVAKRIGINLCKFDSCHRASVFVGRQAHDVAIHKCTMVNGNDQDIDYEPSGSSGEITGVHITDNHVDHTYKLGAVAITVTGVGAAVGSRHTRSKFTGNTLIGGTMQGLNVASMDISGNHFYMTGSHQADPLLKLYRGVDNIVIERNHFYRGAGVGHTGAAVSGRVIDITYNDIYTPKGIKVLNNFIDQLSDAAAINFSSCDDIECAGNTVTFTSAFTGLTGINTETTEKACAGVSIHHNTIRGGSSLSSGIKLGTALGFAQSRLDISHNDITGPNNGIVLNATCSDYPIIIGNRMVNEVANAATYTAAIIVGGNSPRPMLVGTGDPDSLSINVAVGAEYTDRATGFKYMQTDTAGGGADWTQL